jgi:hypothetical protein
MGFDKLLRRWATYGILAPSHLNRQPWSIKKLAGATLEVGLDPARRRGPDLDPTGRADLMALGALVEYLVLSAPALGCSAEAQFDPEGLRALVTARLAENLEPEPLFGTLATREDHGGDYKPIPLTEIHEARFQACGKSFLGVQFFMVRDESQARSVTDLLRGAVERLCADEARLAEVAAWLREGEQGEDGIPYAHAGLKTRTRVRLLFQERFDPWEARRAVARKYLEDLGDLGAPAYLILAVPQETPALLFAAGRAAARQVLTAADMELDLQIQSLLLDQAGLGEGLDQATGIPRDLHPVFLARTGLSKKRHWPKTPRRSLDSFGWTL